MEKVQVESGNIASIGYDPGSEVLEVEFLKGRVYQYYDVPEHVYEELMADSSHGSYLAAHIKGTYSYSEI